MLGIVFGPFIPVSDQHSSLLLNDGFLAFRDYNKTDLMSDPAILARVSSIGTQLGEPFEDFLTAKPMVAVQANYELFLYAFFIAVAEYVIETEQPDETVFGFISSGIFPALCAADALPIETCFKKLRPIYQRYFRKAAQDMEKNKSSSFILESDAATDPEFRALLATAEFDKHVFIKDRRGPFSYSMAGQKSKLRAFKEQLAHLPIKAGHVFPSVSSHTPQCRAFVRPGKIKSIPFSQNHRKLLMGGKVQNSLGTLPPGDRQRLIDHHVRMPMETYDEFEKLSKIARKIVYIGGQQTALIAKTFLRHKHHNLDVILI